MDVWRPCRSLHTYEWFTIGFIVHCISVKPLDGRLASIQEPTYLLVACYLWCLGNDLNLGYTFAELLNGRLASIQEPA